MLRTHCSRHKCFPVCRPARATLVADTNILCPGYKKMFLILFRNILCPQQMFPSLRSMETQHSFCVLRVYVPKKHHEQQCVRNNVSSFAWAFTLSYTKLKNLNPILIFIATSRETVFQPEMFLLYLIYAVTTTCHGSVDFSAAMPWSESGTEPRD